MAAQAHGRAASGGGVDQQLRLVQAAAAFLANHIEPAVGAHGQALVLGHTAHLERAQDVARTVHLEDLAVGRAQQQQVGRLSGRGL